MTVFNLAILLLRLAAVNSFLIGLIKVGPGLAAFFASVGGAVLGTVLGLILLALATALWMLAPRIAKRMSRECDGHVTFTSLNMFDCYTLIFVGVGLVHFIDHLGSSLSWLYFLFVSAGSGREHDINFYTAFEAIFPILVSVLLLARSQRWAKKFSAAHIKQEGHV